MTYRRLPYEEYFINTSEDYTHTGRASYAVKYMPPFRGFTMIHRVKVGTDLPRSFFRLIHPIRYHVHYDLPELYKKLAAQGAEEPPGDQQVV